MQIVIDIPEESYKATCNGYMLPSDVENVVQGIKNGTPLPKGHGRLKDFDKIEWYGCTTEFDCPFKYLDCKDCERAECDKTQVDEIPTIIDKED